MSDLTLRLSQRPDHTVEVGDTILIDGDPFVVRDVKAQREEGVFLDFGQNVRPNVVIVTIERFDGYPA